MKKSWYSFWNTKILFHFGFFCLTFITHTLSNHSQRILRVKAHLRFTCRYFPLSFHLIHVTWSFFENYTIFFFFPSAKGIVSFNTEEGWRVNEITYLSSVLSYHIISKKERMKEKRKLSGKLFLIKIEILGI